MSFINRDVFEDLFVLEMANNHWGQLDRGKRIVDDYARVARYNNIRAAIKIQLRDVESFVHPDHQHRTDVRYIKKTMDTWMSRNDLLELVGHVHRSRCIPMATPFDEASVDFCVELEIPILKLASSDLNDWVLIERIATTRLPVIASTGGSSQKDLDDLVMFFANRNIPLALNHCVSIYPTEDHDLELNQVDYLVNRYPGVTVGFSSHEYSNWEVSIAIAYAKGARTFERHVDIEADGIPVSSYCSLPEQVDTWFKAFSRAKAMCGASGRSKRIPSDGEIAYLDALVRGAYAKHDFPAGHILTDDDYFFAVPLQKGQLSCRELFRDEPLARPIAKNEPVTIDHLDTYDHLGDLIRQRGLEPMQEARLPHRAGWAKL